MLDSPRSASPTSPTPIDEKNAWTTLFFCRFPGCNKGYASTDGVRKHCRKHHADWLADLDNAMRENNQKHSAATYCSTQPAEPAPGEFAAVTHARKRQRADSGASSVTTCTPSGTPRLDPTVARPEPTAFEIGAGAGAHQTLTPVWTPQPTKEEIFSGVARWPEFGNDDELPGQRLLDAPDRPLLSALAALDEHRGGRGGRGCEPVSQNFFSLSSGMPVPKRGLSLTSEAMAELAAQCELDAHKSEAGHVELADLNEFLRDDAVPCPSSPEHRVSASRRPLFSSHAHAHASATAAHRTEASPRSPPP